MKRSFEKILILAMVLVFAAIGICGCAEEEATGAEGMYYLIVPDAEDAYWQACYEGFARAAEAAGVSAELMGAQGAEQAEMIRDAAATLPSGIAVAADVPFDVAGAIDEAVDAGVPVVCVGKDVPESGRLSFIGTGNYEAGMAAAGAIAQMLGGSGVISGTLLPGDAVQEERWRGVYDAIAGSYPDITVIDPASGRGDSEEMARQLKALLEYNPQIKGIIAGGDGDGAALVEAVTGTDLGEGLSAVTFDGSGGGDGFAMVASNDDMMGYWAFELVYSAARGEKIPEEVDTGYTIVK